MAHARALLAPLALQVGMVGYLLGRLYYMQVKFGDKRWWAVASCPYATRRGTQGDATCSGPQYVTAL